MFRVLGIVVGALFALWLLLALIGIVLRLVFWIAVIGVLVLGCMVLWEKLQAGTRQG